MQRTPIRLTILFAIVVGAMGKADADGAVSESVETNNSAARGIHVVN